MSRQNQITQRLNIKYPVIQAPMLGVTSPKMVAAVANAGGLGSLPIGGLPPEKAQALIRQTKALTNQPFAVNLFTHTLPDYDVAKAGPMQDFLVRLCADNGIIFNKKAPQDFKFYTYHDHIQLLLDEDIKTVSFTFGAMDEADVALLHRYNITLIGTATSVSEAKLLAALNIDMICAQGFEAGGHRGSFLDADELPATGTFALLPQICKHIAQPVIASGGINNGQTIRAAFELGAQAVQIGTAFINSYESMAIPAYKAEVASAADTTTAITRAFSGRWARGIKNKFMEMVEASGIEIPPYPIQNSLISDIRPIAQKLNNKDFTTLWAGQNTSEAIEAPSAQIFNKLIADAGL